MKHFLFLISLIFLSFHAYAELKYEKVGSWDLQLDGTTFGIIPSTTTPFCANCDRSRLTADGFWYLCLYAKLGIDLREPIRGKDLTEVRNRIRAGWQTRTDRGAEERKLLEQSSARGRFIEIEKLRQDPRLEMHARGG